MKTTKANKWQTINDLPFELRGPPQNKYGGYRSEQLRGFRGNTYGPASGCRTFTEEQEQAWAAAHTTTAHASTR